jgi:hypothetical protein
VNCIANYYCIKLSKVLGWPRTPSVRTTTCFDSHDHVIIRHSTLYTAVWTDVKAK